MVSRTGKNIIVGTSIMSLSTRLKKEMEMAKKQKNPSWPIPVEIAQALEKIQDAVDELVIAANHKQKKFTLDGRIMGDIGEVIAAYYFDIQLTEKMEKGFDAKIKSGPNEGAKVEIKCRKHSAGMGFHKDPAYIIIIEMSKTESTFELIYAGSAEVLSQIHSGFLLSPNPYQDFTFSLSHFAGKFNYQDYMLNPSIPITVLAKSQFFESGFKSSN